MKLKVIPKRRASGFSQENKMSKEEMVKKIKDWYFPTWEAAAPTNELVGHVENLYDMFGSPVRTEEFYILKIQVFANLSFNCIEEFERGKHAQGRLTRMIFNDLFYDLHEQEVEPGK